MSPGPISREPGPISREPGPPVSPARTEAASRFPRAVLVRHGETAWSRALRHTGRTDVPLSSEGEGEARALAPALAGWSFALVLTSPLRRASDTCRLANLGQEVETCSDLVEWDYGSYEGRTTEDIRAERPGWWLWRDGVPTGETLDQLAERADRVVAGLRASPGDVAVFAHGHILRVLAARWVGLEPAAGAVLVLGAGLSLIHI